MEVTSPSNPALSPQPGDGPPASPPSAYAPPAFQPGPAPQAYSPGYGVPAPRPAFYAAPLVRSPMQWRAHVLARFDAGMSPAQLFTEMAASGLDQRTAFGIVGEVTRAMRMRSIKVIAGGGIMAFIGLAGTLASMAAADSAGGGMYLHWWGPVIFGSLTAVYGLYLFARVPRLPF